MWTINNCLRTLRVVYSHKHFTLAWSRNEKNFLISKMSHDYIYRILGNY